jgi:hypothetical protein
MTIKENNANKCTINSKTAKDCMLRMVKSPSNWVVLISTYLLWTLVGMRYSSNQNFDMVTAQQDYVMYLSLISIIAGLMHHQTKLIKLALTGAVTVAVSFITVVASKVSVIWLGYPIGNYLLCPITLFLFLQQIRLICCFACRNYCAQRSGCNDELKISDNHELQIEQDVVVDQKPIKKVIKKSNSK